MPIPILTPDNSRMIQCADPTCAATFAAPMPQPEIINTPASSVVLYKADPFDCPNCGAIYRWLVSQVQTAYVIQHVGGGPAPKNLHVV